MDANCIAQYALSGSQFSNRLTFYKIQHKNRFIAYQTCPHATNTQTEEYRINLWFPSMCHKAFGPATEYVRRLMRVTVLRARGPGLTLAIEALTRLRWTYKQWNTSVLSSVFAMQHVRWTCDLVLTRHQTVKLCRLTKASNTYRIAICTRTFIQVMHW